MNRRKLLIVTSKDDSHADHVITKLNDSGQAELVVRLNTEDFVDNCEMCFDGQEFTLLLKDSARKLCSTELKSVWYRRPVEFLLPTETDAYVRAFITKQSTAFLRGLYFTCHDGVTWVNPLPALHRSRIKMQQLQLAQRLRMSIPATLITNDPAKILSFYEKHAKICTKSLDEPNFTLDGHLYPVLTRVIESKDELTDNYESLQRCPVFMQEYIEKAFDLRVIIFGRKVFAFEIHSQTHPLSQQDTRGVAPHLLTHVQHTLPPTLQAQIIDFVEQQGLVFSAMDLVVSQSGAYYFLENNPNGQWLWLEFVTGCDLTSHLIDVLL